jgi:hypothetical protein
VLVANETYFVFPFLLCFFSSSKDHEHRTTNARGEKFQDQRFSFKFQSKTNLTRESKKTETEIKIFFFS